MCATSIATRRPRSGNWPRASSPAMCWSGPASSPSASRRCGCWPPRPTSWAGRRPTCGRWSPSWKRRVISHRTRTSRPIEDLLSRLETGSGVLADAIDIPPMSLREARASFDALRRQASDLPPAEDLATLFREMQATARREGRSLTDVSAAIGLAAAKAGVEMGNVHIFDFYRDALGAIREEGLLRFLRRVATPYVVASGEPFRLRTRRRTPIASCAGSNRAAVTGGHETSHKPKFDVNVGKAPRNGWRERVHMGPAKGPNGYWCTPCGDRSLAVTLTAGRPRSEGFAATPVVEESSDPVCGCMLAAASGGDCGDHRRGGRRRSRSGPRRADRHRRGRRQRAGDDPR